MPMYSRNHTALDAATPFAGCPRPGPWRSGRAPPWPTPGLGVLNRSYQLRPGLGALLEVAQLSGREAQGHHVSACPARRRCRATAGGLSNDTRIRVIGSIPAWLPSSGLCLGAAVLGGAGTNDAGAAVTWRGGVGAAAAPTFSSSSDLPKIRYRKPRRQPPHTPRPPAPSSRVTPGIHRPRDHRRCSGRPPQQACGRHANPEALVVYAIRKSWHLTRQVVALSVRVWLDSFA